MPYFVYILKCTDNSLYTGICLNIEQRLAIHRSGKGSKYVKTRLPFTLVYQEECESKSAALKREYAIKQLPKMGKQALINT